MLRRRKEREKKGGGEEEKEADRCVAKLEGIPSFLKRKKDKTEIVEEKEERFRCTMICFVYARTRSPCATRCR